MFSESRSVLYNLEGGTECEASIEIVYLYTFSVLQQMAIPIENLTYRKIIYTSDSRISDVHPPGCSAKVGNVIFDCRFQFSNSQ